ncbi:MAG: biotin--[acetyl-CoA-carboxylase] ligase [Pseudomonadota bacterium]|nr:biotin--[acetyl-CoA-carboxylase] ligase [Pseudomonadota bacterium]
MRRLIPDGYRLLEVEDCASTNDACLEAAVGGDPGRLWIRAERQHAGRGSRGRSWQSGSGNLFASLLLVDPAPMAALANLTFVAALGVHDAIETLAVAHGIHADIKLKWPNDVLVSGRKISGILLENHDISSGDSRRRAIVIGIGINCAGHPSDVPTKATDMTVEGMATSARDLMPHLATGLDSWLQRWNRGAGFADIRRHWLARAAGLDQRIVVKLGNRQVQGVFEDIDAQGLLCLRLDDGSVETLSSAEVFFGTSGHGSPGGTGTG